MEWRAGSGRIQKWFAVLSVVAALYLAREVLQPIALAIFAAYVLSPVVRRLHRWGVPRLVATVLTMLAVGALVSAVGWMLLGQLRSFSHDLPLYRGNLREKMDDVRGTLGREVQEATSTLREIGQEWAQSATANEPPPAAPARTGRAAPPVAEEAPDLGDALLPILEFFGFIGLVFLLACVMLLRWNDLRDRFLALAGESELVLTTHAASEASAKIDRFLRRQLMVNAIHGTVVGLILWRIGVPNPLVWAILAGSLRFIPYLGPIVSTAAPIAVSLASSPGWTQTLQTAGSLLTLELITNNVLEPLFYEASTGASPLALLVSAAFWTWLWGPVGLLLSTPLTVCLIVIGKHVPSLRFFDLACGNEPAISNRSRFYYQLLAGESEEACAILQDELSTHSFEAVTEDVLVPALRMAAHAHDQGRFDDAAAARIGDLARRLIEDAASSAKPHATGATPADVEIACLPARDVFDAAACDLLAALGERRGVRVRQYGSGNLLAEVLADLRARPLRVVVISSVPPTHFLYVRSVCKRLLAEVPDAEIVVGLWGEESTPLELTRRLPASTRVHIVRGFAGALDAVLSPAASQHPSGQVLARNAE